MKKKNPLNFRCPNKKELELLIDAFNNPELDSPPQKPDREKVKEQLRNKGYPEIALEGLINIMDTYDMEKESYEVMIQYGTNRKEAIICYVRHLTTLCPVCLENYTDILNDEMRASLRILSAEEYTDENITKIMDVANKNLLKSDEIERVLKESPDFYSQLYSLISGRN